MYKLKILFAGAALLAMTATSVPSMALTQSAEPAKKAKVEAEVEADPVAEALRERGEAYHRAPDEKQDPQEQRVTNALNAEILDQNDLAEMEDRANQAEHAKAEADYQAELARVAEERARIAREAAANEAAYADRMAQYERDRADWQACVAGDRTRCR